MKRSINQMIGYTIQALDGPKGSVKNILFDEENWVVRYIEADPSIFNPGNRILIPRQFLKGPMWSENTFEIDLTGKQIEGCPPIEQDLPISRRYEEELASHYKVTVPWHATFVGPGGAPGVTLPPRPVSIPDPLPDESIIDSSLRSFREVKGYDIHALDGSIGHIEDLIVDVRDWQIVYMVVDTSNWLPWSKRVILEISHLKSISYKDRTVKVDLMRETIKNAPEFDASQPVNLQYERKLYDYYGRQVV